MKRKSLVILGLSIALSCTSAVSAMAAETLNMERCGAFLFEWRPVDCGNGRAFAILVGGNTIQESDVILNPGYDYMYTFYPNTYGRPWGTVPELVNINGLWGIPENEALLPEGAQQVTRIILHTNNKNLESSERYVDVVALPGGVNTAELPLDVRKYLINVDGSDAGAYVDTVTAGWWEDGDVKKYRNVDGNFITNSWVKVDQKSYYLDENGVMLKDTITPDGFYVNRNGEKTSYIPGWTDVNGQRRYIQKNGYYAANGWIKDENGDSYYFDLAFNLLTDTITPDGYYVDAEGKWDGNPSTLAQETANYGPSGMSEADASEYWQKTDEGWKYHEIGGSFAANTWKQDSKGLWYYLDSSGIMLTSQMTPDGYYVDENGVWTDEAAAAEDSAEASEGTASSESSEASGDAAASESAEASEDAAASESA